MRCAASDDDRDALRRVCCSTCPRCRRNWHVSDICRDEVPCSDRGDLMMWTLMSGLGLNRNDENGQRGATQQLTSPSDVDCGITKARAVRAHSQNGGAYPHNWRRRGTGAATRTRGETIAGLKGGPGGGPIRGENGSPKGVGNVDTGKAQAFPVSRFLAASVPASFPPS
jgi:hypothetical protein